MYLTKKWRLAANYESMMLSIHAVWKPDLQNKSRWNSLKFFKKLSRVESADAANVDYQSVREDKTSENIQNPGYIWRENHD